LVQDGTRQNQPVPWLTVIQRDRTNLSGKGNYSLLRLLSGNALKRKEVSQLSVRDARPNQ
jgi:hypothetical protein